MTAPTKENKRYRTFEYDEEVKMHEWIKTHIHKMWEINIERFPNGQRTIVKYRLEYSYQDEELH